LDGGLLLGANGEVALTERFAPKAPLIELEHPAFFAKSGSRGKGQLPCCQGRIASAESHRKMVVLQLLFVALTGERSTLAVVASTLVIAALFNPLRRRIQSFIDRPFYRRKYEAAKTLEVFSMKLRDETGLETLSDDLLGVIRETRHPAHASFWL
jgi:hypothetical protein